MGRGSYSAGVDCPGASSWMPLKSPIVLMHSLSAPFSLILAFPSFLLLWIRLHWKLLCLPWPVWLSGLSTCLQTERLPVFPFKGTCLACRPGLKLGACERQLIDCDWLSLSHIDISHPLFLPPFPCLKINKISRLNPLSPKLRTRQGVCFKKKKGRFSKKECGVGRNA